MFFSGISNLLDMRNGRGRRTAQGCEAGLLCAVNSNEAGDIELSDIKWKWFSCFELFIIRLVCNTCGRTNDVEIYGIDRRFDLLGCLYDAFLDFQSEGE